jgi:hypothetical protein
VRGVPWKSQTRPRLRFLPIATCGGLYRSTAWPFGHPWVLLSASLGQPTMLFWVLGPVPDYLCAPQGENSSSAARNPTRAVSAEDTDTRWPRGLLLGFPWHPGHLRRQAARIPPITKRFLLATLLIGYVRCCCCEQRLASLAYLCAC